MANSKISALTSATTVAGTEVLPIVQSSATVKVAISDLNPGLSTITAAKGGTGQTSYAVGDLLYADTTTTLAKLADVATGNALISGGVGVAPSYGKIGLTTHVSGTLPVANGGTGTTTAFTTGSVVFAGASGVYSQNNANFFWDNTNIELGIGTSSPSATMHASAPLAAGTIVNVGMFGQNSGSNPTVGQGARITLSATNNTTRCTAIEGVHESGTNAHYLAFLTSANGTNPAERLRITSAGNVIVTGVGGLGYGTGSGGTVTQGTSRTTGVTLNKTNGAITLFTAAGSITATTFTVTNSTVAATDTIILSQKSGTNLYMLFVTAVAAGSFNITFLTTGGVASDAPVINFAVIKAVIA